MTNRHEPLTEQELLTLFHNATPEVQDDVMKFLNGEMSAEEMQTKYNVNTPATEPA